MNGKTEADCKIISNGCRRRLPKRAKPVLKPTKKPEAYGRSGFFAGCRIAARPRQGFMYKASDGTSLVSQALRGLATPGVHLTGWSHARSYRTKRARRLTEPLCRASDALRGKADDRGGCGPILAVFPEILQDWCEPLGSRALRGLRCIREKDASTLRG